MRANKCVRAQMLPCATFTYIPECASKEPLKFKYNYTKNNITNKNIIFMSITSYINLGPSGVGFLLSIAIILALILNWAKF